MSKAYSADKMYHLHTKPGDVGRYVILPGDPGRCEKIAAHFEGARLVAQNREFTTYTGALGGVPVSVCSTGIGGPSAAIALEELFQCGADTFIRVGTAGGMQLDVLGGDVVVATGAIRLDGTSKEYAPIEYPAVADFSVTCALAGAAKALGKRVHTGVVQCKDNYYGQHEPGRMPVGYELINKWEAWIKCGALASEMESATLFIAGGALRARVGAVLLVVANQERRRQNLEDKQVHDTEDAIQVAVEALRRLIAADAQAQ